MEKVKAGFVEKIGSTVFIVNAMPSENASETQEELVKALIIKDVMASKPGTIAQGAVAHPLKKKDRSKSQKKLYNFGLLL